MIGFGGCDKGSKEKVLTTGAGTKVPGGTLIAGLRSDPDALNPLTALSKSARDVIGQIFRRLADLNEDLVSFSPQLARSWEYSPDSLSITFHLRTDVSWHDGAPFKARDVLFTYHMHVNPEVTWDGISFKESIRQVTVPDDSTVIFEFHGRTPTMLMDAVEGYIVPAHLLEGINGAAIREADFNRNPVGTGPFRFMDWKSQQSVTLTRNKDYYEADKPYLDRVVFKVVSDNVNLWQQLISGDIDLFEGIHPRNFSRLVEDWEAGNSSIRPVSYLGRSYVFIGWNLIDRDNYTDVMAEAGEGEPNLDRLLKPNRLFGSQKARAALTMALDRTTLTQVVSQGMAVPMDGPIPPILWAYNPDANTIWPYDQERASKMLKEEGWTDSDGDGILDRDGVKFSFEMVTLSGSESGEHALAIIQDQLRQVGVEMTPRMVDPGLLYGRMLPTRAFDATIISWNTSLKMDLAPIFHSSSLLTPFNFPSYRSAEFDRLEGLAKESLQRSDAQNYWDQVAGILSRDLPYTWLYYRKEGVGVHQRFRDVIIDKRGALLNVEDWWVPEDERTTVDKMGTL